VDVVVVVADPPPDHRVASIDQWLHVQLPAQWQEQPSAAEDDHLARQPSRNLAVQGFVAEIEVVARE
jgi:hypothetical protein